MGEPPQCDRPVPLISRQEFAHLFSDIKTDRTRLSECQWFATRCVPVDDRWYRAQRIDLQEFRCVLLALEDVYSVVRNLSPLSARTMLTRCPLLVLKLYRSIMTPPISLGTCRNPNLLRVAAAPNWYSPFDRSILRAGLESRIWLR